ncbi:hypothetical protein Ae406Ps2_0942c [Pseudonocardia sp. Ae406_Ps2]|nr:hypothetical protein Ae406Ps2_0942c [Pseudonocardia sp. Ae406_Ps2]OLM07263.1 hypothetical protein Ae331Ps2_4973 [Pseudonocardia sp. Ae331_Ps2]OLM14455.1 hypothetical protein Ae505Ps2_4585 [Pseudonocardia sp. Ae505_Ps2]OLM22520.1 hypothetical protein Ae706Ps2_0952c [Pseudonocardia sp. Ae706_Ps2]
MRRAFGVDGDRRVSSRHAVRDGRVTIVERTLSLPVRRRASGRTAV